MLTFRNTGVGRASLTRGATGGIITSVFELKIPPARGACDRDALVPQETPSPAPTMHDEGGKFLPGNAASASHTRHAQSETITQAECEDVARRILREGGNTSVTTIARELGWSPRRVRALIESTQFKEISTRVGEEFWGSIDDHIKNERLDSMMRVNALTTRGMTVLGEILSLVQDHTVKVKTGTTLPRATLIKAGVDAIAEIRQTATQLGAKKTGADAPRTIINIKHASLIQGAIKESGVNLSDVLDGYLDVEVVSETTDPPR